MAYAVQILPSAEREMKGIPHNHLDRIIARIDSLSVEPRPMGVQKLSGSQNEYRIRQGVYRILYRIDEPRKLLFVYSVAHRKDAYR